MASMPIIRKGIGIELAVICKLPDVEFVEAEELSESDRGHDGSGSTDVAG